MEGVERNQAKLVAHNKKWEEEFLAVKEELEQQWKSNLLDVQHVGSTAIPSICAKPVLDVAVKLNAIKKMEIDKLLKLGYCDCGPQHGNANHHLFVLRDDNELSLRHIHCYDKNEREFDLLVGFRDYLITHSEEARRYEKRKMELAEKFPDDRASYTKGKEALIQSIYRKL